MLVIEHYYALKKFFFGGRFTTNELPAAFCKFVYMPRWSTSDENTFVALCWLCQIRSKFGLLNNNQMNIIYHQSMDFWW